MRSDPWKYRSTWLSEVLELGEFTAAEVDAILAAVAVVSADPSPSLPETAWILKSGASAIPDGTPMGLLLSLTYTGDAGAGTSFDFSYKTEDGVLHRLPIV